VAPVRAAGARDPVRRLLPHYALSLPTSVVITGIDSLAILKQAFDAAASFRPLEAKQLEALLARTAQAAADGRFEPFKTSSIFDSTAQNPDWLGEEPAHLRELMTARARSSSSSRAIHSWTGLPAPGWCGVFAGGARVDGLRTAPSWREAAPDAQKADNCRIFPVRGERCRWHRPCEGQSHGTERLSGTVRTPFMRPRAHGTGGVAVVNEMKAFDLGCLTSAFGLVGILMAPSTACARDTAVAEKTAHPVPTTHALATVEPLARSAAHVAGWAGGGTAPANAAPSAEPIHPDPLRVDVTKRDAAPAEASCDRACELSSSSEISLLPKVVMRTLVGMPVVGTFLITPVTTGVTVAPVDGLPALTFTVKPTQIAQGSGLVAVGRF
jgi:hypothetical protein